jgi:hypothetical protein
MECIESPFILYEQHDKYAASNAEAKAQDVNHGMEFTPPQGTEGNFQVVLKHSGDFRISPEESFGQRLGNIHGLRTKRNRDCPTRPYDVLKREIIVVTSTFSYFSVRE